jgi:Single Cache domain 2
MGRAEVPLHFSGGLNALGGRDTLEIVRHFRVQWRSTLLSARILQKRAIHTGRETMVRAFMFAAATCAVFVFSTTAFAQQQYGNRDEAKAMLLKTVAAVKADKTKALDMIAKGEGGFLDRDLYPFCTNVSDGKILPFPNPNAKPLFGTDARNLKDPTGKEFGKELYSAGQKPEGQITEVMYMFSRPGDPQPVPKVSFVARATADIYCGVGYYK